MLLFLTRRSLASCGTIKQSVMCSVTLVFKVKSKYQNGALLPGENEANAENDSF